MVGILTKHSPEKSNAPHIPGVPSLGLNIDRCIMWSTRKRRSRSRLGHDKWDIPAFGNVSLQSNLLSPRQNYLIIITTDINVLHFGSVASKRLSTDASGGSKIRKEKLISGSLRGNFWQPQISLETRKERSCQSFSTSHIGPKADCLFHRPAFFRPERTVACSGFSFLWRVGETNCSQDS